MKMSAVNQNQTNGKKSGGSSSSSAVNTPTPTPVSNTTNGQNTAQSSPPPNNNAPKYGKHQIVTISTNNQHDELQAPWFQTECLSVEYRPTPPKENCCNCLATTAQ